jgi:hypothetical protein
MVTLEQVKLLEAKVTKAVDYVERVSRENVQLQGKLDSYQKRIDELEVLIRKFKEDQGRIEDGILSALDRLNKFEDAIEKSITPPLAAPRPNAKKPARANEDPLPEPPVESPPVEAMLDLTPVELPESPDIPPVPVSEPFAQPVLLADLLPGEILPDISIEETGSGESKGNPAAGELDIF